MTSCRSQALNRPRSCNSWASRSTCILLSEGLHHTVSSPALWIDAGSSFSPRSLVASARPSAPATNLDRVYDFRAAAYSAARPARPAHPCAPPEEWNRLATMFMAKFFQNAETSQYQVLLNGLKSGSAESFGRISLAQRPPACHYHSCPILRAFSGLGARPATLRALPLPGDRPRPAPPSSRLALAARRQMRVRLTLPPPLPYVGG